MAKKQVKYLFASLFSLAILFSACSKDDLIRPTEETTDLQAPEDLKASKKPPAASTYVTYTIAAGGHYSDKSVLKSVKTSDMKFAVIFDNSAIYTSALPENQLDINKLYGFSEGFNNQYNSARIGWNWYNNELNLHAYVYNKGVRSNKKITSVAIGAEHICSIKVVGSSYIFTVNGISVTMSRGLSTSTASGYQQYPYFGGDEVAPHTITIKIKNL